MKQFKCKYCGETRDVSFWKELCSFHLFGKWVYVKCPKCGKRSWMRRVKMKDCKYYCKEYLLEGMCKKHSNWTDAMPHIVYCSYDRPCNDYEFNKKCKPKQLPGQLDMFNIIDNK